MVWNYGCLHARAAPRHVSSHPLPLPLKITTHIHGNCNFCLQENRGMRKCLESPTTVWHRNMGCRSNVSLFPGNHDHLLPWSPPATPEHHSYPKYTAAIKNSLKRTISCLKEMQCRKDVTVQGRERRKIISSLYRSKIRNSKQLALHMGRKVRSRRKKDDVLEQSVPAKHTAKCGTETCYSPTNSKRTGEAYACQHFHL